MTEQTKQTVPHVDTKRAGFDVPVDLYSRFKAVAALRGVTMSDLFVQVMQDAVRGVEGVSVAE